MSHRPIAPIDLNGSAPGGTPRALPIFEWVDPATLLVDEDYQRESSEQSLRLVRKIVAGWDWARFKPPVAVLTDAGLELLDGQHNEYRDISTAPRDGTVVEVMDPELGSFAMRWKADGFNSLVSLTEGILECPGGQFTWSEDRDCGPRYWRPYRPERFLS